MRILIPTRNSAAWIEHFADSYRALSIRPFYVVDERSNDATLAILRERGEDYKTFRPTASYVEAGMTEAGAGAIDDDWILRIDDDEFPSDDLLRLDTTILDTNKIYGVERHEAVIIAGTVKLALWPSKLCGYNGKTGTSRQYRLFYKPNAIYNSKLHTPGVETGGSEMLPSSFHMTHFNCVLRTPTQRLDKIRAYALHNLESYIIADESLPELNDACDYDVREIPDALTRDISDRIPHAVGLRPVFNRNEIRYRRSALYKRGLCGSPASALPVYLQLKVAELLGTISRFTGSEFLKLHSEIIWNHAKR